LHGCATHNVATLAQCGSWPYFRFGANVAPNVPNVEETPMAWKTPKIVEVPVGMEINMYACAVRK
jgi:coenzyme PQQ precursor peptide PqqA